MHDPLLTAMRGQRSLQAWWLAWLSEPGLQLNCIHMPCANCNLQAAKLASTAAGAGALRARSPAPSSASSLAACIAPMEKPACAPRDTRLEDSRRLVKRHMRQAAHMPSQDPERNKFK